MSPRISASGSASVRGGVDVPHARTVTRRIPPILRADACQHDVRLSGYPNPLHDDEKRFNRAHVTWLEHALVARAQETKRCHLGNANAPQEPALSEAEKADTQAFLREMLQILPLVGALRVTGLTAPGVFDGAIDGESFRAYIEQILVPTLQPSDIVIADNLGAHKVAGIQRAIQAAGATLWYLPPYSPDLNPIELCFAKLKALVRTARCRSSGDALAVPR